MDKIAILLIGLLLVAGCTSSRPVADCSECKEGETCLRRNDTQIVGDQEISMVFLRCTVNQEGFFEKEGWQVAEGYVGAVGNLTEIGVVKAVNKSKGLIETCKEFCPFGSKDTVFK